MTAGKFAELREALYERSPDSRGRVAEKVAGLSDELGLSDLRARAQRTQAEMAEAIGTSQSGISRLERQTDVLVSTLRDFVAATGGRLSLVARYPEYECEIYLPILDHASDAPQGERTFRVIWQNTFTRQFVHVGQLQFTGRDFSFNYTPDAELDPDFEPFPSLLNLRETYRSEELFSFFADRIASTALPDQDQLLAALGLTQQSATPTELLARSWGTTPHDTIQVVPDPQKQADGSEFLLFLASGIRYADPRDPQRVAERIGTLREGQILDLHDEPENHNNHRAIALYVDGYRVGWIPDYLLDYVHKQRDGGKKVTVAVEHANGVATPWHLLLLARLEVS